MHEKAKKIVGNIMGHGYNIDGRTQLEHEGHEMREKKVHESLEKSHKVVRNITG